LNANKSLIEAAEKASKMAYAPASHYAVGAALLTASGRIFTGCNIENASFPVGICAERVAMAKAISEGEKKFEKIAIYANGPLPVPCGMCRQFMAEFNENLIVIAANEETEKSFLLKDLLPQAFRFSYPS